jgi:PKD repeat protein
VGTLDTHTVQWDFGDGSAPVSGTLTPTHTFAAAGSYTVRLTVTDDDTGVGEDTLTVTVMPSSYPLFLPFLARPAAASPPIPGRAALPPRQLFQ